MTNRRDPYLRKCPICGGWFSTRGYGAYKKHYRACARKEGIKRAKAQVAYWQERVDKYGDRPELQEACKRNLEKAKRNLAILERPR